MGDLLLKIFNMSFNAGIMVLAVLIIRLFTKKAPKLVNILLWSAVALRLCLPFSFESMLSLLPSKEVLTTAPPSVSASTPAPSQNVPQVDIGVPVINDTVNEYINESTVSSPKAEESFVDVMFILSIVWACGVAIMLFYALISYIRLKRTVRISVQKENNVFYCDNIRSPFVLGFVRPKIYLPSGIEKEDERYVLMHENAHIKRKDFLWKPLGFLLLSVHWFNPVIWLAYTVFCRDIELACDEKAINNMSKTEIIEYSKSLLNCTANPKLMMVNPLAFGEVSVKNRIKNILNYKKPSLWIIITAVILSVCLAVGFLTDPLDKGKTKKKKDSDNITETVTYEIIEEPSSEPTEPVVSEPIKDNQPIKETDTDIELKIKKLYLAGIKNKNISEKEVSVTVLNTFSDGSVGAEISNYSNPVYNAKIDTIIAGHKYKEKSLYRVFFIYKNDKLMPFADAYKNGLISKKIVDEYFQSRQVFNKSVQLNGLSENAARQIINDYIDGYEEDFCEVILKYKLTLSDSSKVIWIGRYDASYPCVMVFDSIADEYLYGYSSGYGLAIYKNGEFKSIKQAYETGLISKAVLDELFEKMPNLNTYNRYITEDDYLGNLSLSSAMNIKKDYYYILHRAGKEYNEIDSKDILLTYCGKLSDGSIIVNLKLKKKIENEKVFTEEVAGHKYEFVHSNKTLIYKDYLRNDLNYYYERGEIPKTIIDEFFARLPEIK